MFSYAHIRSDQLKVRAPPSSTTRVTASVEKPPETWNWLVTRIKLSNVIAVTGPIGTGTPSSRTLTWMLTFSNVNVKGKNEKLALVLEVNTPV